MQSRFSFADSSLAFFVLKCGLLDYLITNQPIVILIEKARQLHESVITKIILKDFFK